MNFSQFPENILYGRNDLFIVFCFVFVFFFQVKCVILCEQSEICCIVMYCYTVNGSTGL